MIFPASLACHSAFVNGDTKSHTYYYANTMTKYCTSSARYGLCCVPHEEKGNAKQEAQHRGTPRLIISGDSITWALGKLALG
jgi:hypothetical protein